MTEEIKQKKYTFSNSKAVFVQGMQDGIPIGLGYFAVAFSLGVVAKNAGLTAIQGFIASILCTASAGEYIGFTLIAASATCLELALVTLITNARYLLMSCAMSQRTEPSMPWYHRMLMAYTVTDELFGIAIARPGYLNPYYSYGAVLVAAPLWAIGTSLGVIAGNLMPLRLVSALSVALYGMFLAVIIPPAKKSKIVAGLIVICFAASYAANYLPVISEISSGTRTIILTVVISSAAAILFPREENCEEQTETKNGEQPQEQFKKQSGEKTEEQSRGVVDGAEENQEENRREVAE